MSGAESINLSIDYVPIRKYDDMKKLCTKRYEQIKELEAENKWLKNELEDYHNAEKCRKVCPQRRLPNG